jgi:hypothetical protein
MLHAFDLHRTSPIGMNDDVSKWVPVIEKNRNPECIRGKGE